MVTFCTIVTPAMQAQARALGVSLRRHHPDARLLAALPESESARTADASQWEPVAIEGQPSIPALLEHALHTAEVAVFLAPDVYVYESLEPAVSEARAHGVALVPRVQTLPEDGQIPGYEELVSEGTISPALVAVGQGQAASDLLAWWTRRRAEADLADGRWLTLAAEQFPDVSLIRDPGFNVSFWNLHERPLGRRGDQVQAAGKPLRFMHFSGFRADRPYWLSQDATRVSVIDDPVLAELCGDYAQELLGAGWEPPRRRINDLTRLGNGQRVDPTVQALWEEALDTGTDFGDPLSGRAADDFVAWLREPAFPDTSAAVSRYLLAHYRSRPDLQQVFPQPSGPDAERLVAWARAHRHEVLVELVEAVTGPGGQSDTQLGVNVIGYLGETLGLAEAARLYVRALDAAGVAVSTTAVRPDLPVRGEQRRIARTGSHAYEDRRAATPPSVNLACLNGDHLAALVRRQGRGILQGLPTIGQWGWETDVLPPSWEEAFPLVDEVWVYSRFMAEKLGRLLPMPVVVVPPAIVAAQPAPVQPDMARDDRFTFVFMLDFFSTLQRKNPLGLIRAFTRAFSPGEGPRLLIKTINAQFRREAADQLRFHVADRPDIELIDAYLDGPQKAALLQRANCYVSLHRSEGFGLPLAECMALGTPVIATDYSGNTDFTTAHNSYLVDWSQTRVGPEAEIYPAQGTWAEPDLEHAAELMRHVWRHPDEAAEKGQRARLDIEQFYAPTVVGAIARARLERMTERGFAGHRTAAAGGDGLEAIEPALSSDLREGVGPTPKGPAGLIRRAVLRLILPFSYHERQIDRALVDTVRQLGSEVGRQREQSRHDRGRLHELEASVTANGATSPESAQSTPAGSPPQKTS